MVYQTLNIQLQDQRVKVLADVDVKIAVFGFVTPCLLLDEYIL